MTTEQKYQKAKEAFFKHFDDNHQLTVGEDEMFVIISLAKAVDKALDYDESDEGKQAVNRWEKHWQGSEEENKRVDNYFNSNN